MRAMRATTRYRAFSPVRARQSPKVRSPTAAAARSNKNFRHSRAGGNPSCSGVSAMSQTRVDAYEVFYSSNSFAPRIGLKNAGVFVGQMIFMPNGSQLPPDASVNGQVNLYYRLDDFQNAID